MESRSARRRRQRRTAASRLQAAGFSEVQIDEIDAGRAGFYTRHQIIEHLRELGAPLRVAADSHQPDVLREMVDLGLGWTVLPAASEGSDRLVRGPVLFDRSLVLARRAGAVTDPAADELADRIRRA